MSDSSQNPPPDAAGNQPPTPPPGEPTPPTDRPAAPPPGGPTPPTDQPSAPPPSQSGSGTPPPPPAGQGGYGTPPPGQGSYGTTPPPQGGWQQPGPMPPPRVTGGIGQPADLLPRFAARLIDVILLGFSEAIVFSIVVAALAAGSSGGVFSDWGFDNGTGWAFNAVSSVFTAALWLGYFTLMEARLGKTVGKMVMRLETRGPDGGRPTMQQAVKRNAFTAIGIVGVIPYLGFVSSLLSIAAWVTIAVTIYNNTATRHGWHDDFAGGTTVFRIG